MSGAGWGQFASFHAARNRCVFGGDPPLVGRNTARNLAGAPLVFSVADRVRPEGISATFKGAAR